jgi:hypothetical protein
VTKNEKIVWEYALEKVAANQASEVLTDRGTDGWEAWYMARLEGEVYEICFKRHALPSPPKPFNLDAMT